MDGAQPAAGKAQAKGPAGEIGEGVCRPDQGQHREQEVDADGARLRHCQPGQPQRHHASRQAQCARHLRPAGHAGAQQRGAAQHPGRAAANPQPGERLRQPACRPAGPAQGQAQGAQCDAGGKAQPVEAPPFPGCGGHGDQRENGKGPGRRIQQRRQQDGQQDQGGDDALLEHPGPPFAGGGGKEGERERANPGFRRAALRAACRAPVRRCARSAAPARRSWRSPRPARPRRSRARAAR